MPMRRTLKKTKAMNKSARGPKLSPRGGNLRLESVSTQAELHRLAREQGAIYVGATDDPHRRRTEHAEEGYSGTMYVTRTKNMKLAENKLLQTPHRHNVQKQSNVAKAEEAPGYVYVIKGRKYN